MDGCKHKAAASSINWMVGLIKGKEDAERKGAVAALSAMFAEMVEGSCMSCTLNKGCKEMIAAKEMLSGKPATAGQPQSSASAAPGALLHRRMHQLKTRLTRPTVW
ncbi:MAG: hypothetical protein WCF85_02600 [Rhodospirillaceae bacterium]